MTTQTRLFVGGVPVDAGADVLRESFGQFGSVVACELKSKPSDPSSQFAFITIDAGQLDVEACIRHFTKSEWRGARLHVTRARESFLERLQKERAQAHAKTAPDSAPVQASKNYDISFKQRTPNFDDVIIRNPAEVKANGFQKDKRLDREPKRVESYSKKDNLHRFSSQDEHISNGKDFLQKKEKLTDAKKISSDYKRLESMKKMRKEFNEKKLLIKTGLAGVDKASNKKIKFDDDDEPTEVKQSPAVKSYKAQNGRAGKTLFDDDEEEDDQNDVNFQIKEQFEGRKGQKVLELQSRFKSDKRFAMDQRFIEDNEINMEIEEDDDRVQVLRADEKATQLNILQNVLGHAIRSSHTQPEPLNDKKARPRMGMLRFDPNHPDHAKFLAPKEALKNDADKNNKKKKRKETVLAVEADQNIEKVEVSKEQFYKVSDTLKEAIAQPNSFSLRSLFSKDAPDDDETHSQETGFTPLAATKKDKVKNPLDKGAKNPFKYDSSESEAEPDEEENKKTDETPQAEEGKGRAVWREKLFFARFDTRFKEGLAFFNNMDSSINKERRELKVLMKKRLHNRARKDTMFQKKIGGKRKNFNKNRNPRKQSQ